MVRIKEKCNEQITKEKQEQADAKEARKTSAGKNTGMVENSALGDNGGIIPIKAESKVIKKPKSPKTGKVPASPTKYRKNNKCRLAAPGSYHVSDAALLKEFQCTNDFKFRGTEQDFHNSCEVLHDYLVLCHDKILQVKAIELTAIWLKKDYRPNDLIDYQR